MFQKKHICLFLLTVLITISFVKSSKHSTPQICLNLNENQIYDKLKCEKKDHGLIINLVEYSNDHSNLCTNDIHNNKRNNTSMKCSAYPTHLLADFCNGKSECLIKLEQTDFKYGFNGANCDFRALTLSISYDCIPKNFYDQEIPKFDICSSKPINHPIHGFIHSPNYPENYDSAKFCQTIIKIDPNRERLEVFLIDMELEDLSKRTANPTDYLQIENGPKYFGRKQNLIIYNQSSDATIITFKSDQWFTKRGFFIYFNVIKKIENIDLQEIPDLDDLSTTTISTTTTTLNNITNSSSASIKENRLNVNDIVSASQYKTDKSIKRTYIRNTNNSNSNSFMSDHTTKAILTLLMLVVILTGIILFLVFSAKQRIKAEAMLYKSQLQMDTRYGGDQSILSGAYMDSNLNYQTRNHMIYQLNNMPRASDNSMAQLLLNTSAVSNNNLMMMLPPPPLPPQQISINAKSTPKFESNNIEVYDYISDEKMKLARLSQLQSQQQQLKQNEYTTQPNIQNRCSLEIVATSQRPLTTSTALSNQTESPSISPKSMSQLVTSTPSAPSKQTNNQYDTLSEKSSSPLKNTRKDLQNDYYDDNYQIPSNLPSSK